MFLSLITKGFTGQPVNTFEMLICKGFSLLLYQFLTVQFKHFTGQPN